MLDLTLKDQLGALDLLPKYHQETLDLPLKNHPFKLARQDFLELVDLHRQVVDTHLPNISSCDVVDC